ncbi:hypothetical protein F4823DRAFT_124306 [Ustulina deusta]|nr:hypothetical protein F4823DRAFT_124306 [Ustulina deusta]
MINLTMANFQDTLSSGGQIPIVAVKAAMLAMTQIMALNGLLILVKLCRTGVHTQHKLAVGTFLMYQVRMVLALPVSSGGSSTDIAMESYNLNRTSFMTMAALGAIMTAVSLINLAIVITESRSRRRHRDNIPRHPANCEDGAAAHAALGQPVTDGAPTANSEEELSSLTSEIIASAGAGGTGSGKAKHARPRQEIAPMPAERLCRGRSTDSLVEDEVV